MNIIRTTIVASLVAFAPLTAMAQGTIPGAAAGAAAGGATAGPIGAVVGGAVGAATGTVGGVLGVPVGPGGPGPCETTTVTRENSLGQAETVRRSNC